MAEINVGINLWDNMSPTIAKITGSVNGLKSDLSGMSHIAQDAFNGAKTESMTENIKETDDEVKKTTQDAKKLKKAVDDTDKSSNGLRLTWGSLASIAGAYLFGSTARQAIEFASDLGEVQNVVDVSFGEMASSVNEWSKTALTQFGLNELSAKRFASTTGAMLKSTGLSGDAVADMSMKVAELAGDMASFYNLDGEEAFNKIRSGISGETEPLKQLGIDMSDTALQAYALSQGIQEKTKDMDNATKVTLRYKMLLEKTADAQGDFARTSDSFANQQKLLQENWKQLTGEIASNFLPMLANIMQVLNSAIASLSGVAQFITDHWAIIEPFMWSTVIVLGVLAVAVGVYTVAQWAMNSALLACPLTWIVLAIIIVIGALILFCNWIAETTGIAQSGLGIICGAFMVAFAGIWNYVTGILNAIIQFVYTTFLTPIVGVINFIYKAWQRGFSGIGDTFRDLFSGLIGWLIDFAKIGAKIIDSVFGSNLSDKLDNLKGDLQAKVGVENDNAKDLINMPKAPTIKRMDYSKSWEKGVNFGDKLGAKKKDDTSTDDLLKKMKGNQDTSNSLAGQTAQNTKATSKGVNVAKENLAYMRDIAEKEAINQFTTAQIKVDMTNNNNVNSGLDLNGMIKKLSNGVKEAMQTCADGVY